MFTIKQETANGDKLWPNVDHVYTDINNTSGITDVVHGLFAGGGTIEFHAGPGRQIIYVMSERGSTVARYDIGYRGPRTEEGPPLAMNVGGDAAQADPAKLAA